MLGQLLWTEESHGSLELGELAVSRRKGHDKNETHSVQRAIWTESEKVDVLHRDQ